MRCGVGGDVLRRDASGDNQRCAFARDVTALAAVAVVTVAHEVAIIVDAFAVLVANVVAIHQALVDVIAAGVAHEAGVETHAHVAVDTIRAGGVGAARIRRAFVDVDLTALARVARIAAVAL